MSLLCVNTGLIFAPASRWGDIPNTTRMLDEVEPDTVRPFQYLEFFVFVEPPSDGFSGADGITTYTDSEGNEWEPENKQADYYAGIAVNHTSWGHMMPPFTGIPRDEGDAYTQRHIVFFAPQARPLPRPLTIEVVAHGQTRSCSKTSVCLNRSRASPCRACG